MTTFSSSLTEELVCQYRKAFAVYGQEKDGKIQPEYLGTVIRCLGQNPTEAQIRDMKNEVDADRKGGIEFNEFLTMMQGKKDYIDSENEVMEAFRVFDKEGTGFVSAEELREVLTSLGEKLTQEEVEELFKEGNMNSNGMINYFEICQAVIH